MKKLKLNLAHEAGEILTKEEMRGVLGGAGSGKYLYKCECTPPAIGAWEGYYSNDDEAKASTVKWCSNQSGNCRRGS